MLFRAHDLAAIADGRVSLAFRRWDRPRVRPGTRLRTAAGVLEVTAVDRVERGQISRADALAAGAASPEELLGWLDAREGTIYRVALRPAGPDPRIALRADDVLTPTDVAEIGRRLDRFDAASQRGPWTHAVLALIGDRPEVRAPDLAASLGRETPSFKRDVRKLKELGLTESLVIGYRLSPRGRAYLASRPAARRSARR
jgi:hypothetical protein